MEANDLKYTNEELNNLIEYYLGTPKVYNYCYENSPEFKKFVDNADDEMKSAIKKMHTGYNMLHCKDALVHLGSFGLSWVGKKIAESREFAKLDETIKSDEFKILFENFNEIVLRNKFDI